MGALMARGAIIADLPLGGTGALDREFGAVMACAGVSSAPLSPQALLSASFDAIAVAPHSEAGGVGVRQILYPRLNAAGEWAPSSISG
jgi:hypothetical protein